MHFAAAFLATDYTPPAGFSEWIACAFYAFGIFVAIAHYRNLGQAKNVRIEANIATTDYVDGAVREMKKVVGGLLTEKSFEEYKKVAERDRGELKDSVEDLNGKIEEVEGKIEKFSGDNYRSRRGMHKKINAHSNALYFMAGQSPNSGAIKRILERGETEEGSED